MATENKVYFGASQIKGLALGNQPIKKAYLGDQLIFEVETVTINTDIHTTDPTYEEFEKLLD